MIANTITLLRVGLAFLVVGVFSAGVFPLNLAMLALTVIVIMLDWLDGLIARRLGEESRFGALFDIAGDRIVENVFWIYFSAVQLIPFWVPMVVISRGILSDLARAMAFARGKTPFGQTTMMRSGWARLLVASRFSRGLYAAMKLVAFVCLGALLVLRSSPPELGLPSAEGWTRAATLIIVYAVVALCVIRGVPVIWGGRRYLLEKVK